MGGGLRDNINFMHKIIQEDCQKIVADLGGCIEKLSGKTILITGFSGFIGTYLAHMILYANQTVLRGRECTLVGLDNFMRGKPAWVSEIEKDRHVKVLKYDITRPITDELEREKINFIIHAASIASPTYYRKFPIETMDTTVNGLRNLLDYSVRHKGSLESFLFFSTSEIYGDPTPENIPTSETYRGHVSCVGPRACYDESKRYGETLCMAFHSVHGLPIKIVRPFNNYGPGLKITDKRVIPDFFRNVFEGKDIVLFSDGSPTRTFCYIADAVTGYFRVLLSDQNGEAFNIGTETPEISMSELAERIKLTAKNLLDREINVRHEKSEDKNYLLDNPTRRSPIIKKARILVGYNPTVTLEEGLQRTALWYKDNLSATEK